MANVEKVLELGIEREAGYLYFVVDNKVVRAKKTELRKRETVKSFRVAFEPGFTYFLDSVGDLSRSPGPGMTLAAPKATKAPKAKATKATKATKAKATNAKAKAKSDASGVTFEDKNLQLAVLAGLVRAKKIRLQKSKLPIATDTGPDEDDEDYDGTPDIYTYNQTVANMLLAIELPEADVERLETIDWVDHDITSLIFPQWSGEEHEFDVHDLAGIEQCTALTSLKLHASTDVTSIAPLATLTKLTTLALGGASIKSIAALGKLEELATLDLTSTKITDLSPLLELAKLDKLTVSWSGKLSTDAKAKAKKVVAQLKKRGVEVEVEWP